MFILAQHGVLNSTLCNLVELDGKLFHRMKVCFIDQKVVNYNRLKHLYKKKTLFTIVLGSNQSRVVVGEGEKDILARR